jgi:multiple sugar transport system substrate-binding protein
VVKDAQIIKQKHLVEYPLVWSWSQAEALVCDYAVLLAANKGQFTTPDGKPAFQTGGGLKAAEFMVQTLTEKLSNPHSLEYVEDDVKRVFSSGQAAIALNWTYMWDGANTPSNDTKVAGQVGVEAAPGFAEPGQVGTVNGTQPLGIPINSKNKDAAWDYIVYLTSPAVQNAYATNSLPVWKNSFSDPKVIAGRTELLAAARASFAAMINRPEVVDYQQFSSTLQQALQQALAGKAKPAATLKTAADALAAAH